MGRIINEHIELLLSLQMFFPVIKPSEFDNQYSWKLGFYLPIETGR